MVGSTPPLELSFTYSIIQRKTLTEFYIQTFTVYTSRYSNWLRAGQPGGRSSSPGMVKNFLFSTSSRPALGPTQPPIQWVSGVLYPGVKRPGREADHSPPVSAEVKKMWIYTSTPPYAYYWILQIRYEMGRTCGRHGSSKMYTEFLENLRDETTQQT
jgi:hypothetical protein